MTAWILVLGGFGVAFVGLVVGMWSLGRTPHRRSPYVDRVLGQLKRKT